MPSSGTAKRGREVEGDVEADFLDARQPVVEPLVETRSEQPAVAMTSISASPDTRVSKSKSAAKRPCGSAIQSPTATTMRFSGRAAAC